MKIPVSSAPISYAKLYARESIEHTQNFSGWENEDGTKRKMQRIMIGRFAQLWLHMLCSQNGIRCVADPSGPTREDEFDLRIYGHIVDVKATQWEPAAGQVNCSVYNSDSIDFFAFFLVDRNLEFISPLGVCSISEYREKAVYVPNGECIPDTDRKQKYKDGSYFLSKDHMSPLWGWLKNGEKKHGGDGKADTEPIRPGDSPREMAYRLFGTPALKKKDR